MSVSLAHLFPRLVPLSSPAQVDDSTFKKILKHACSSILGVSDADALLSDETITIDHALLKNLFGATSAVLLELARVNATKQQTLTILEDLNLPPERLDLLCQALEAKGEEFRANTNAARFRLPAVVGVKWRVDYAMQSKHIDKINSPEFLIELQLEDGTALSFWCTRPQLKDLVSSLRDAVKQVERSMK